MTTDTTTDTAELCKRLAKAASHADQSWQAVAQWHSAGAPSFDNKGMIADALGSAYVAQSALNKAVAALETLESDICARIVSD